MLLLCDYDKPSIGTHIEFESSLTDTYRDALYLGLYTVLIDLGKSRNMMRKRIDTTDLASAMNLCDRFPLKVYSIIPSYYNLAGSRKFLAWNGNEDQDVKTLFQIQEIEYELYMLSKFNGTCIMELGSYRDRKQGIQSILRSFEKMTFKEKHSLSILNSLNENNAIGTTFEEIHSVISHMESQPEVSIAIHTFFCNGLYDIRLQSEIDRLFKDYFKHFKVNPTVILLSDTQSEYGSKSFMHAPLGEGEIWKDNIPSLFYLVDKAKQYDIPIQTTTIDDMELLRHNLHS